MVTSHLRWIAAILVIVIAAVIFSSCAALAPPVITLHETFRADPVDFAAIHSQTIMYEGLGKGYFLPAGLTVDSINSMLLNSLTRQANRRFPAMRVALPNAADSGAMRDSTFILEVVSFNYHDNFPVSQFVMSTDGKGGMRGYSADSPKRKVLELIWELREGASGKKLFTLTTEAQVVAGDEPDTFRDAGACDVQSVMNYIESDGKRGK
jgi:hypothetical protein